MKKKQRRNEAPYSHQFLKECLEYNPLTGNWIWLKKSSKFSEIKPGDRAGVRHGKYNNIRLIGITCRASNVAWFYMTGEWPKATVDHINRIHHDDRWENLRLATRTQQMVNVVKKKKSGLPIGVCKHTKNRFRVRICEGYKVKWVGCYETVEEAEAAYIKASESRKEFLPMGVKDE